MLIVIIHSLHGERKKYEQPQSDTSRRARLYIYNM